MLASIWSATVKRLVSIRYAPVERLVSINVVFLNLAKATFSNHILCQQICTATAQQVMLSTVTDASFLIQTS